MRLRRRLIHEDPTGRRLIAEETVDGTLAELQDWQATRMLPAVACEAVTRGGAAGVEMTSVWCPHQDATDVFPVVHGPGCPTCARKWRDPDVAKMLRHASPTWREPTCRTCRPYPQPVAQLGPGW